MDDNFLAAVNSIINPWNFMSGTEHMGRILYDLIRATRPRTVIEDGTGYTTPFLAKALLDNLDDFREEKKLARDKLLSLPQLDLPLETDIFEMPQAQAQILIEWVSSGGKANCIDPRYYVNPYVPRLFAFEHLGSDDAYVKKIVALLDSLKLSKVVTMIAGSDFVPNAVPIDALPIDLAWTDHAEDFDKFFDDIWPLLNPKGGTVVFHFTEPTRAKKSIQRIKDSRAATGDLECLSLVEPHKLFQNGCTLLRRTTACGSQASADRPVETIEDIRKFVGQL